MSTEGNFTWADRGTGNFTAWAKNQPNNFGEEDCVHALGVEHYYKWNDVKCSDCHQYTCKKGKLLMSKLCRRMVNHCLRHVSHEMICPITVHGNEGCRMKSP